MPWAWTRRQLARAWRIPPWQVDDAPACEVLLEIKLSNLEAESRKKKR